MHIITVNYILLHIFLFALQQYVYCFLVFACSPCLAVTFPVVNYREYGSCTNVQIFNLSRCLMIATNLAGSPMAGLVDVFQSRYVLIPPFSSKLAVQNIGDSVRVYFVALSFCVLCCVV